MLRRRERMRHGDMDAFRNKVKNMSTERLLKLLRDETRANHRERVRICLFEMAQRDFVEIDDGRRYPCGVETDHRSGG